MTGCRTVPLSRAEFEEVVAAALDSLPKRFADLVRNVAVTVEEEPGEDDRDLYENDGDDDGYELLGVYRGVPLTKRGYAGPELPDQIAIFRGPINRIAPNRQAAIDEVRETVIHELGHYFGLEDDELP